MRLFRVRKLGTLDFFWLKALDWNDACRRVEAFGLDPEKFAVGPDRVIDMACHHPEIEVFCPEEEDRWQRKRAEDMVGGNEWNTP